MAKREQLRKTRAGTIINISSSKMETQLMIAVQATVEHLSAKFKIKLEHSSTVMLSEITNDLKSHFPDISFSHHFENTYLKPDGGILYVIDGTGNKHVILISEAKRQGTNDARAAEGLSKQAKGNAIERLGKNLIGLRAWMSHIGIFPFVVFGEGVDFDSTSSILDRVATMAMFAPLNSIEVNNVGESGQFNRGSFYFRVQPWKAEEITPILIEISERSLYYYFSQYGEKSFHNVN